MTDLCKSCGRELTFDEIALYKRLCGKLAEEFCCLSCTAEHFKVSEGLLRDKIRQFREDGCTLFQNTDSETGMRGENSVNGENEMCGENGMHDEKERKNEN